MEQTLSIIKPDAVERHLEDEIKQMFLEKGFKIIKEKNSNRKLKQSFFIKYIRLSHFIMIYALTFHQDQ